VAPWLKTPVPRANQRVNDTRDLYLGVAAVVFVLVVIGWWWVKFDIAHNSERARQADLANLLASVDAELDALNQKPGLAEREVTRTDSEARDLVRGGHAWELAYVRERKRLLDDYVAWLRDFATRHPAKIAVKAARDLGNADAAAALSKAQDAHSAALKIASELRAVRAAKVGVPLWSLVARQKGPALEALLARVTADEASSGKAWAEDEKKRLAYLDINPLRLRGDESMKFRLIGEAVGSGDPDLARWSKLDIGPNPDNAHALSLPGDVALSLVWIEPGSFTMGSPGTEVNRSSDEISHRVTLSRGHWLGKTEVTQRQWESVLGNNPSSFKRVGRNGPVEKVSWEDAMEFCRMLTEKERRGGRLPEGFTYTLPTEAQWEHGCRAGTTGTRAGDLEEMGWYKTNSGETTHPVGEKQANGWGLYDMHGNVWEWCRDWAGNYPTGAVTDPTGATSGSNRILRGGCWYFPESFCRSADRNSNEPGFRNYNVGFRLALSFGQQWP